MPDDPLAVSVKEAMRQLGGVSVATIYRMMERGQLAKRKIGGRTVITMQSVRAILERGQ